MKRYVKNSLFLRKNRAIKSAAKNDRRRITASTGGTVTLKDMNTDVIPVADFGCYGGILADALEDVFVYDAVNLDYYEGSEYYDEVAQLIDEKYDGTSEFFEQVLEYAPATIQAAFDDYGIAAKVIPGSCRWNHPRYYNYSDDVIEFDMTIDTDWVESKLAEFGNDPDFKNYIKENFSSRSGFISYMPDDVAEYSELLDPSNPEYWKVVSAVIQYIVDSDRSIAESATMDLYDDLISNANYVTMRSFD